MAVAVHHQRGARLNGRPRPLTVKIEVPGGAIHLERGAGRRGGLIDRLEVQGVPFMAAGEAVGWVGEDVDQRMPQCGQTPAGQLRTILSGTVVKGCEHDVEPREQIIRETAPGTAP